MLWALLCIARIYSNLSLFNYTPMPTNQCERFLKVELCHLWISNFLDSEIVQPLAFNLIGGHWVKWVVTINSYHINNLKKCSWTHSLYIWWTCRYRWGRGWWRLCRRGWIRGSRRRWGRRHWAKPWKPIQFLWGD